MTGPERDAEFEAYLRRRSVLPGREPGLQRLEPPEDLDNIVLRNARQAIQGRAQMPLYRAPRWALPVALVATILLTFSVVLNVSLNTHKPAAVAGYSAEPAAKTRSAEPIPQNSPTADAAAPEVEVEAGVARKSSPAAPMNAPIAATYDPDAWLKRIDVLRARGKTRQADDEMRRFQVAFPGYLVKPATTSVPGATK